MLPPDKAQVKGASMYEVFFPPTTALGEVLVMLTLLEMLPCILPETMFRLLEMVMGAFKSKGLVVPDLLMTRLLNVVEFVRDCCTVPLKQTVELIMVKE